MVKIINSQGEFQHIPVLKKEILKLLKLKSGDKVVDCTLGLGGHAEAMLMQIGKNGQLLGIDLDEKNLRLARERLMNYANQVVLLKASFVDLESVSKRCLDSKVEAVLFDLGLSSPQVDEGERGFSFLKDGPLRLQFDNYTGRTAADLVNNLSEKELAEIFWKYGEERDSRKVARAIVKQRQVKRIERTKDLADLVVKAIGTGKIKGRHPATKVFQALRIAVNDELNVLEKALRQAVNILKPKGRVGVISYHSLEDRVVKNTFKELTKKCICLPLAFKCECKHKPAIKIITKKPVVPSAKEIKENFRSRSAKLRVAEKNK